LVANSSKLVFSHKGHILPKHSELASKLADLISKYNAGGIPSSQITILTAKTEEKSCLADV